MPLNTSRPLPRQHGSIMLCHSWRQTTVLWWIPSAPAVINTCETRPTLLHTEPFIICVAFLSPGRCLPFLGIPCESVDFRISTVSNSRNSLQRSKHSRGLTSSSQVIDTRPVAARTDFSDLSAVDKYVMPTPEYENRTDSVLAWKKAQKLGRFDPNAPSIEQQKILASQREVEERGKCLPTKLIHALVRLWRSDTSNIEGTGFRWAVSTPILRLSVFVRHV